jgi:hypothetical protein
VCGISLQHVSQLLEILLRVSDQTQGMGLIIGFMELIITNDYNSPTNLCRLLITTPVTVAERSKVCTVFALLEAGTVGLNPTQGMDV